MDEDLGLRERKKRATRAALSAAALRLSAEHGVGQVTVEQIAAEAGVAVRTFFNYFSCKEEAVVAGDSVMADSIVAAFGARPPAEPVLDALRAAVHAVVDEDEARARVAQVGALRRDPGLLPYRLSAFAARERALAAVVSERTGIDAQDVYPVLLAACAMAALRVAVQRSIVGGEASEPFAPLVDAVFAQLAAGLGAPVGAPA